jgi:hypothetical protein
VEHFLHRAELRRLVNEAIADARAQDQAHSRRRRTPGLATIIRQARAVIFGISI